MFARLADALAQTDAPDALRAALAVLLDYGLSERPDTPSSQPWLTLEVGAQRLDLYARGEPACEAERATVTAMLRAALLRVEEHETCRRMREHAELLASASFEGLFFHVDGVVFDVNQQLLDMLGANREDFLGGGVIERYVAPAEVPGVIERVQSGYEGIYVVNVRRKDGTPFRAEFMAKQGKLGARPVRVAAVRDITERERTEALLRESEMRLRELARSAFDVIVYTRDDHVVEVDGDCDALLGYTRDEMVGRRLFDFVAAEDRGRVACMVGGAQGGVAELSAVAKSGEPLPVEVVAVITTLRGAPVRMSAVRDLREAKRREREREQLQAELANRQRVESLGVLAGGVAHDFNNLLTVILGHAELLERRLAGELERRMLRDILDAGQRAASLTSQLLAYVGRKELGPRVPIDLGALVEELRTLLGATLSKKAELTVDAPTKLTVLGNRTTLTQLIMNLLTNASDALGERAGQIVVRVRSEREPDARFRGAVGDSARGYVLLEVEDEGAGMDEATRERIFEPFFSTKERGHGLGLAASQGIVAAHHGAIHVASELGKGTTFSVLLPAHDAVPRVAVTSRERKSAPVRRRVLVVDDEPLVRGQLRLALEAHGYDVELVENGRLALARMREEPLPDVVLLDMTMPDLSGLEVLIELRRRGVRVPVVLSSGYHDMALELPADAYQGFLVKPYSLVDLCTALERAVASGAPSP